VSRNDFAKVKRVVVKIGSSLLTKGGQGLDKVAITAWVKQMAGLRQQSIDVVLVSSGSVAEGMSRLGLKVRPKILHELQAQRQSVRWVWCGFLMIIFSNMAYMRRRYC